MELKHGSCRAEAGTLRLLIVPYGIETQFLCCKIQKSALLIVPYGIETL